jgi:hydrogenase/urease accessory protein HupE
MSTVFAHTQFAGVGDFWNGTLHPLYTPAHVVLLIALGLCLGHQSLRRVTTAAVAFGLFSALGVIWAIAWPLTEIGQAAPLAIAMLVAVLIALDRAIPEAGLIALYAAGGLLIGADSGVAHVTLTTALKMSLGTWLSVCFVVFNIAFHTARLTQHWQRIGVRIAASWIVAISMLVLAFAIRH